MWTLTLFSSGVLRISINSPHTASLWADPHPAHPGHKPHTVQNQVEPGARGGLWEVLVRLNEVLGTTGKRRGIMSVFAGGYLPPETYLVTQLVPDLDSACTDAPALCPQTGSPVSCWPLVGLQWVAGQCPQPWCVCGSLLAPSTRHPKNTFLSPSRSTCMGWIVSSVPTCLTCIKTFIQPLFCARE